MKKFEISLPPWLNIKKNVINMFMFGEEKNTTKSNPKISEPNK